MRVYGRNEAFEMLLAIVGPKLILEIIEKMGGRQLRIRKRVVLIKKIYNLRKREMETYTIRQLCERLGCTRTYARMLRLGLRR